MHSFTQQMLTKSVRATLSWFQLYTSRVKKNVMLFIGTLLLTLMKAFFFFLFDVGHFKNLEFVTILLPFYVLFFFGLQACGILAPEQGCNLYTLCWKVKS